MGVLQSLSTSFASSRWMHEATARVTSRTTRRLRAGLSLDVLRLMDHLGSKRRT